MKLRPTYRVTNVSLHFTLSLSPIPPSPSKKKKKKKTYIWRDAHNSGDKPSVQRGQATLVLVHQDHVPPHTGQLLRTVVLQLGERCRLDRQARADNI